MHQLRHPSVVGGMVACLAFADLAAGQSTAPAVAPAPLCRPAGDAQYGVSRERPVQVGGGPMYGLSRERRYLDSLRGPKGETLRYSRSGSTGGPDDTLLDMYHVTYDGLAAGVTLFLDVYRFTEPLIPQGFVCGRAFELHVPLPDPFLADEQLAALAAEVAAAPGFRAAPVPLGDDPAYGVVIDRFRLASRRVRASPAAAPSARTPAPGPVPADARTPGTIVVAFPQLCGGQRVSPSAIALVGGQGMVADPIATYPDAAAVRQRAPGQSAPEGSVAAAFEVDALLTGWQVRVSYSDPPCAGEAAVRKSAIAYGRAVLGDAPMPARPADDVSGVPWVIVQAVIDHQGAFQQLRPLGGPPALVAVAVDAIRTWKARPAMANGLPVASAVVLQVTFQSPPPR